MSYSVVGAKSLRSGLLLSAASAAIAAMIAPALAQDQSNMETVVVTGSRIPQQGLYSSSPVTVVSAETFKNTGATNVEQLLRNELPSLYLDGDNGTVNNGSNGISTVDLRGLGPDRTLVLVDGKRLEPAINNATASGNTGEVDLAQIPAILIDHIEVATGGESSVYGGDAVSGVVNVILKKNFEGVEASGQYTTNSYGDGPGEDLSFLMGTNSANDKGNVTVYGEYFHASPISDAARPWAVTGLGSPNYSGCPGPAIYHGLCASGSGSIPLGRIENPAANLDDTFTSSGGLNPYAGQTYNFSPSEYLQAQHERYAAGAEGHYEVNKQLDFYTRVLFADNDNHNQLAPVPFDDIVNINCGNPYMSNTQRSIIFPGTGSGAATNCASYTDASGRTGQDAQATDIYRARLTAAGARNSDFRDTEYQILIGAKGDFGDGWSYDVSGQFGRSLWQGYLTGDTNTSFFDQTLLVDTIGQCSTAGSNPGPSCYPSNIFQTQSAVSKQAVSYFSQADLEQNASNEWDAQANLVGDLGQWGGQSPWAKSPIGVAGGLEYRQESSSFISGGPISVFGGSGGYGFSPAFGGAYDVKEAYTEVKVPLVENMPWVESFEVDGGYRYSSYSLSGDATTWKAAAIWQVDDNLRLRGSIDRAVREPHLGELFGGLTQNAAPGYDPCGPVPTGQFQARQALCTATGVPSTAYGTSSLDCQGQCNTYYEGNLSLRPEIGNTKTVGVVFTPTFFDGLTATVDYYNIRLSGAINNLPFQSVIDACYSPVTNPKQTASAPACSFIHRDALGTLNSSTGYAVLPLANISAQQVRGMDIETHYRTDLDNFSLVGWGAVGLDFVGTWTMNNQYLNQGVSEQCAGRYDQNFCTVPAPRWKHNFRVTWYAPGGDFSFYTTWRFFTSSQEQGFVTIDNIDARAPGYSYFDLGANYDYSEHLSFYVGANNILNRDPPVFDVNAFSPAYENANTFPGMYDNLGTVVFAGATVKF